ncbi:MAG: DUF2294 domain-containing protein [Cyanobacteria bacterium P01_C01_bin.89]
MEAQDQKTAGQLEREISQRVNALYRSELSHQPGKITCQLFENKAVIVIEKSISRPEQLLKEHAKDDVAEDAHAGIKAFFREKVRESIEDLLQVKVLDTLFDSSLESHLSSVVVVLEKPPTVRNPAAIPKFPKSHLENGKVPD